MEARRTELGRLVRDAREARGHRSQPAFAQACDISARSVAGVERGEKVGRKTLAAVERGLGWPRDSIATFLETGDPSRLHAESAQVPHLYEKDIRDDFEREIMTLTRLPLDERWAGIFERRERLRQEGDRPGSPIRRPGR